MKFTKGIFASFLVFAFVFAAAQTASAYTHMGMLKMGSTGSQVMELQKALNGNGFLISTTGAGSPGMESSYFGAKTKSAVMAFQSAKGLTPVDGIVGINTGAALGALTTTTPTGPLCPNGNTVASSCMTAPAGTPTGPTCPNGNLISNNCAPSGTTTPTGPLAGTDGTIDTISTLSSYNDEEVGEDLSDVKVAGFEVETSNDGDISISSVKLTFDPTDNGATDSNHLDDYIDSVSVWMGSTKVGSADADDFTENSDDTYTKTVSFSGAIVRADDTEKFYITVDGVNTFDSGDIDTDDWSVGISSLRYVDGSGVTTTIDGGDTEIGGGDPDEIGWDAVGDGIEMNFVDFGTAADTELKVSTATDSPEAGIIMVDDSDSTDGVSLLKGKITLDGDSDVVIDSFPVTLTATGATDIDNITGSLTLIIDGEEYTETVSTSAETSATVTFDNMDFAMSAGDSITFEVKADVEALDGIEFDEGDTLTASVTTAQVDDTVDVENEEGDQLSTSETSGSATGDAQEFRTNGIELTLVSADATKSASDTDNADTATFTIKFKVKAVGEDIYVATTASTGGAINNTYTVSKSSTATTVSVSEAITNNTDTDVSSGGNWMVTDGESETITLTVLKSLATGGVDGLYKAALASVKWNTTDSSATYESYTSNLDEFVTDYVSLD